MPPTTPRSPHLLVLLALLLTLVGAGVLEASAKPGNGGGGGGTTQCTQGAWASLARTESPTIPFASQQECTRYVSQGGVAVTLQAVPPTTVPPTIAPTVIPPTAIPPTDIPPTDIPPTAIPPTAIPPTDIPPTDIPPTDIPPSATVPPTDVPPTPTLEPVTPSISIVRNGTADIYGQQGTNILYCSYLVTYDNFDEGNPPVITFYHDGIFDSVSTYHFENGYTHVDIVPFGKTQVIVVTDPQTGEVLATGAPQVCEVPVASPSPTVPPTIAPTATVPPTDVPTEVAPTSFLTAPALDPSEPNYFTITGGGLLPGASLMATVQNLYPDPYGNPSQPFSFAIETVAADGTVIQYISQQCSVQGDIQIHFSSITSSNVPIVTDVVVVPRCS